MNRLRRVWLYRRKGDRGWYVYWREAGQTHCRRAPTKELAQRMQQLKWAELNAWAVPAGQTPWETLIELYDAATGNLADNTLRLINTILNRIHRELRPSSAADLTPEFFDRYFAGRRTPADPEALPPSEATLAKEWRHLHAFGAWLADRGFTAANPLASVAAPRPVLRKKRVPTEAEWLKLLDAIPAVPLDDPQGWHLLIVLAVTVGLREGDLLALRVSDIELGDAESNHVGLVRGHARKAKKDQWLGLPPAVNDRVAARIASLPDGSDRLFLWPAFQRKAWARLCAAASFRHEFSRLRAASGGAAAFARLQAAGAQHLGHSRTDVFRKHYSDDEALARLVAAHQVLPELPPLPALVRLTSAEVIRGCSARRARSARAADRRPPGGPRRAGAE